MPIVTNTEGYNCPRVYIPVCATDNDTYVNECVTHCMDKGLKKTYMGSCILYLRNNILIYSNIANETEIELNI